MIEPKEFDNVSQSAHFFSGLSVILISFFCLENPLWTFTVTLPTWIALTAMKEFWFDYAYETPEVRGSSLKDFFFYQAGAIAAIAIWWLKS